MAVIVPLATRSGIGWLQISRDRGAHEQTGTEWVRHLGCRALLVMDQSLAAERVRVGTPILRILRTGPAIAVGVSLLWGCSSESGSDAGNGGRGGSSGSAGHANGGSNASGSGGTGASATGGTSAQGGSGSGGAPILEWPTRAEQDCTASRPLTKLNLNPWSDGALAQTSRGTFLLRGKPSATPPTPNGVELSTLNAAGQLGSTISLAAASSAYVWGVDLVADGGGGLTAFWISVDRSDVGHFMFAKLDEAGTVTRPESGVEGVTGRFQGAKVAATTDGYALLYLESSADYSSLSTRFVLLDSQGARLFEPKTLEEQAFGSGQSLIETKNGFAVAYARSDDRNGQLYLRFLDHDGNPDGAPIPLGSNLHSYSGRPSLLVRGDELVVAFSQEQGSYDTSDIALSIHLAKFDLSTHAPILADVGLQTPVADVRNVDPRLVPVGDDLGLTWSQGSVIYICGGCMPDNHLEFVVLDGEDFTPLSQRVVLENHEISGGYTNPQLIPAEDQLLVTSTLEYHTSGEGASASIRCTPKQ